MKVALSWLLDFVDLPTRDPEEIAATLGGLGHEVEGLEIRPLDFHGVRIARVESIRPHPNADKVRLATIHFGDGSLEVVCGAWNFDVGATVAYATVGSVLAGGMQVGERDIRGINSPGMIASERELGLSDEHEGIIVLDETYEIGREFSDYLPLPDAVFDLSITPNRPDAMSVWGVARDLSAKYRAPLRNPQVSLNPIGPPTKVEVEIEDPEANPRFVAREVRRVKVGQSPYWMRYRLNAAGVRPINNVVDVSNYVMVEIGHPIHTFDLDRVGGEMLRTHRAREGDRLTTLDDVERVLAPEDIVISDSNGIVSLAGVMGGGTTEVSHTTTRVLVEAANWDPPSILYTSKRHSLRSEASARFERGVDPDLPDLATRRVCELLVETAGGEVAEGVVDVYPEPVKPIVLELGVAGIARVLGFEIEAARTEEILTGLQMIVKGGDPLTVTVPTFRPDITRPIDLIEEVARVHGFEHVPATLPFGTGGGLTVAQERDRRVRSLLTGMGFTEANVLSFMPAEALTVFGIPDGDRRRSTLRVKNPLSAEEETLRTSLVPGLLRAVATNLNHGLQGVALFEVARVFFNQPSSEYEAVPHQPFHIGLIATGGDTGVFDLIAIVRTLGEALGVPLTFEQATIAGYHPGRAARVLAAGDEIGVVGEVHPAPARAFGIERRVAAAELELAPFVKEPAWWQFGTPSHYPPLVFDLAFEMAKSIPAAALTQTVGTAGGELVESTRLFDEYDLGGDRKSLAIGITLRAPDRTLTDEEAAPVRQAIIDAVEAELDAKLRGA
jgi:phenylalanyl-tRNA synthetase beta chain